MRIKFNNEITEVNENSTGSHFIMIGVFSYQTHSDTQKIADQLLKEGYVDLSIYERM